MKNKRKFALITLGVSSLSCALYAFSQSRNTPPLEPLESSMLTPPPAYHKVQNSLWVAAKTALAYNLANIGLADFLGLSTLTHGTGPIRFLNINSWGVQKHQGRDGYSSSNAYPWEEMRAESKIYFHMFKDKNRLFKPMKHFFAYSIKKSMLQFLWYMTMNYYTRLHAMASGRVHVGAIDEAFTSNSNIRRVVGNLLGLFTPIIRFRFDSENPLLDSFEEDPDYMVDDELLDLFEEGYSFALRTQEKIPISHLGISGALFQGVHKRTFSRMANQPSKVLKGSAFLAASAYLGHQTYFSSKENDSISTGEHTPNTYWESFKRAVKVIEPYVLIPTTFFLAAC